MIRVGIMTVSDDCAHGEQEDLTGPQVEDCLPPEDYEVFLRVLCPEEEGEISMQLIAMCEAGCDVIFTTGGIGFSPRDVTPEATVSILDKNAPGISDLLRDLAVRRSQINALERGVAGIHDRTLIVNLSENLFAIREGVQLLLPLLPWAVAALRSGLSRAS